MPNSIPEIDVRVAKIVAIYRDASAQIQGLVLPVVSRGPSVSKREQSRVLLHVRQAIASAHHRARTQTDVAIRLAYVRGMRLVDSGLKLGDQQNEVIGTLQQSAEDRMLAASGNVERNTADVFRRLFLRSVTLGMAESNSRQSLIATMQAQAVTGLVDRRGTQWSLEQYARTVVHTLAHQAATEGTLWGMNALQYDLLAISSRSSTSAACSPYDGKVFSLTGATPDYPVITSFPPFHALCEHIAYPASENHRG